MMFIVNILFLAVLALGAIAVYAVWLQRRAVATQNQFVLKHQMEQEKRDNIYTSMDESAAREEEVLILLRKSVQLQESILKELRERAE